MVVDSVLVYGELMSYWVSLSVRVSGCMYSCIYWWVSYWVKKWVYDFLDEGERVVVNELFECLQQLESL